MFSSSSLRAVLFLALLVIFSPLFSYTDLSKFNFINSKVRITEDYQFFWQQALIPGDDFTNPTDIVDIPFSWSRDKKYNKWGYGTFRTVIKLPVDAKNLGLKYSYTLDNYIIYINGKRAVFNGGVANRRVVNNKRAPVSILKLPDTSTVELIIQISNYDDIPGGIHSPPVIGNYDTLKKEYRDSLIFNSLITGGLFIIGLMFLGIFLSKTSEKATLYLGLFALVISLRTAIYSNILLEIYPYLSLRVETTIGHLTFYIAIPLFMTFINTIFHRRRYKYALYVIYSVSAAYILLALLAPHYILIQFLAFYELVTLAGLVCSLYVLLYMAILRSKTALVTLLGFAFLLLGAVNDILYSQEIIATTYLSSYGMLFFILSQGILLSWRIGKAYIKAELLAKELSHINTSLKRFVPEEFLKFLKRKKITDIQLGDHQQLDMTVMFCDIRDFTTLSEAMTPEENFLFINSFLERIGPVIRENGGFIDKYMGDGIMSLFPSSAENAVNAAMEMIETLRIYNSHRSNSGYRAIDLGIGINTGSLMLGTIGENQRMDSTVISDAVNICSRIESITKDFGINIAISHDTYDKLRSKEKLDIRNIGNIYLKGKHFPVRVYELFSLDSKDQLNAKRLNRDEFEKAVEMYNNGDYKNSRKIFENIVESNELDSASRYYLDRRDFDIY